MVVLLNIFLPIQIPFTRPTWLLTAPSVAIPILFPTIILSVDVTFDKLSFPITTEVEIPLCWLPTLSPIRTLLLILSSAPTKVEIPARSPIITLLLPTPVGEDCAIKFWLSSPK